LIVFGTPAYTSYATVSGSPASLNTMEGVYSSLPETSEPWSASGSYSGWKTFTEGRPIIGFYPAGVERPNSALLINTTMQSSLSENGKQLWFTATAPSTAVLFAMNRDGSVVLANGSASFLNSYTAVPEQKTVVAVSACTITLTNDGHGTVTSNTVTAVPGTTVTLTPTNSAYYRWQKYNVTGGTINGHKLTVTADCTAQAVFSANTFTAQGTFLTANMLSGSWQGIASAFPALKITAYTGSNSADICSTANSSNFAVWGGTGTNANNLSGQRAYKWSAVANCVSPSAHPSAWRISGNFNVKVQRNINTTTAWMTASAQRALFWHGPGQTNQTAGNFIGTGANATASATKTFTGYVAGTPASLAQCTLNVSMGNNNFSPPSNYSSKVKSYAYHRITALTGNWSATGYAK
jgi:hypothetical protein